MRVKHTGTAPQRANPTDAGYDLRALNDGSVGPHHTVLVKTGFAMAVPTGYAGLVMSRSGLALKKSVFVLNSPGLIDPGYTGDVGVILHNAGEEYFDFCAGDRIAQLVFVKVRHPEFVSVESLEATDRGEGGFGSTG